MDNNNKEDDITFSSYIYAQINKKKKDDGLPIYSNLSEAEKNHLR